MENKKNVRVISFYLPQFYPTPENDLWWGKGFTEWTNVGRAKPLFKGHYQPKVPADLGYYDLRISEVRNAQAEMAKKAGIEGFCYWHYWFAGRRLLDKVFSEVVANKEPDFPFCLCWANHSWYAKTWDPQVPDKLLIEQTYPGEKDYEEHFYSMLSAFKDERYIKVNGKLLYLVYAPLDIPDAKILISIWNRLAKENGLDGFYFVGFTYHSNHIEQILQCGFDAVSIDYISETLEKKKKKMERLFLRILKKCSRKMNYSTYTNFVESNYSSSEKLHPCILPNFDHSPRSAKRGIILDGSTPKLWNVFLKRIMSLVSNRDENTNFIFVKAWNEWGEGNYLEPDLKYGMGFLDATEEAINSCSQNQ